MTRIERRAIELLASDSDVEMSAAERWWGARGPDDPQRRRYLDQAIAEHRPDYDRILALRAAAIAAKSSPEAAERTEEFFTAIRDELIPVENKGLIVPVEEVAWVYYVLDLKALPDIDRETLVKAPQPQCAAILLVRDAIRTHFLMPPPAIMRELADRFIPWMAPENHPQYRPWIFPPRKVS